MGLFIISFEDSDGIVCSHTLIQAETVRKARDLLFDNNSTYFDEKNITQEYIAFETFLINKPAFMVIDFIKPIRGPEDDDPFFDGVIRVRIEEPPFDLTITKLIDNSYLSVIENIKAHSSSGEDV